MAHEQRRHYGRKPAPAGHERRRHAHGSGKHLRIKGQMESLDHAYKTAFHAVLNFKSPETSKMVIDEADMP
jgi:hypothetical protein